MSRPDYFLKLWNQRSFKRFLDGGRYHIETSPLICYANQWNGFCMITASVLKELISMKKDAEHTSVNTVRATFLPHKLMVFHT